MISCLNNYQIRISIQTTLLAIGILSVAIGIWQLYQPFIAHYMASGWAFITPGAAGIIAALTWKGIQSVDQKRKPLPDRFEVIESRGFEKLPKEIFCEIFSYLDWTSLGKVPQVSRLFFNKTQDFLDQNPKVKQKIENQWFLTGIKKSKPKILSDFTHGVDSFFCESGLLFIGSVDHTIKIWKRNTYLNTWRCQKTLRGHTGEITSVFFANATLFSGSRDKTIKVWQNEHDKWTCQATLQGDMGWINCVFYADEMLFGTNDYSIKIWKKNSDDHKWSCMTTLQGCLWVKCVFYADKMLFCGSSDHNVQIWKKNSDDDNWSHITTFQGHTDWVSCIFCKDEMLFTGGSSDYSTKGGPRDDSIKIWKKNSDDDNWSCKVTLLGHTKGIRDLFYKDEMLLSASEDGTIKMWQTDLDERSWSCKVTLQGYNKGKAIQNVFCEKKTLFYTSDGKIMVLQP